MNFSYGLSHAYILIIWMPPIISPMTWIRLSDACAVKARYLVSAFDNCTENNWRKKLLNFFTKQRSNFKIGYFNVILRFWLVMHEFCFCIEAIFHFSSSVSESWKQGSGLLETFNEEIRTAIKSAGYVISRNRDHNSSHCSTLSYSKARTTSPFWNWPSFYLSWSLLKISPYLHLTFL